MLFTFRRKRVKDYINFYMPALGVASRHVLTCREDTPVKEIIDLMLSFGFRRIPVVNSRNYLKGIVTSIDVIDYLSNSKVTLKTPTMEMMTKDVITIQKTHDIRDATKIFKTYGKGGYPVTHKKQLKGILTDFDLVPNVDKNLKIKVEEAMTHKPIVLTEKNNIFETAKMMVRGGFRRLPVVKDGILVGIVTPYDIIKYLDEKQNLRGLKKSKTSIKTIMTKNVFSVEPEEDIHKAIKIIKTMKFGGLPVTEDHEIIGIITERDIVDMM